MKPRWIIAGAAALALALLTLPMLRQNRGGEALRSASGAAAGTGGASCDASGKATFDFVLKDEHNLPVKLAEYKGKVVIVNFWATWCPPCREEIPDLIALQERYKDTLQIVGVSQDSGSIEDVRQFAKQHGMNYPTVMSSPEIERLFPGIYALPTSFVIDRDGRIAQKHIGLLNASLTELETKALAGLAPDVQIVYAEDEDKVRLANAAQANKIPGIDLSTLSPERRAEALQALNTDHCTCGCGLTLAQCRLDDPDCTVSLPLAREVVKKIAERK